MKPLPVGKIPSELLEQCLAICPCAAPDVLLGPSLGEDAAVVRAGADLLVLKSDPITFATDRIGWYAVHIAANDVATRGAEPRWLLLTLLLPEATSDAEMVVGIFEQVARACEELGVVLVGGHTEVTAGLERPLACASVVSPLGQARWFRTGDARPGDAIVLAGGAGIEGTAVIAREFGERLIAAGVAAETIARAAGYLDDPGISVVRAARIAREDGAVHAMHDPTEGGVACGLWELAQASGVAIDVNLECVPVLPETRAVCSAVGVDPLGLLASGALLVAVCGDAAEGLCANLGEAGIRAAVVGHVAESGCPMVYLGSQSRPMRWSHRDEIARLYEC